MFEDLYQNPSEQIRILKKINKKYSNIEMTKQWHVRPTGKWELFKVLPEFSPLCLILIFFSIWLAGSDAELLQPDHTILAESDMLFTTKQWKVLNEMWGDSWRAFWIAILWTSSIIYRRNGKRRYRRNALRNLQSRWTNGVVPYALAAGFSELSVNCPGLNRESICGTYLLSNTYEAYA